jgi:hypothetical protein
MRSARCSSSNSLVRSEDAQRATDVSTKVPTRKRFHENHFSSGKTKALSSRLLPRTAANECAFVARERRQHAATL